MFRCVRARNIVTELVYLFNETNIGVTSDFVLRYVRIHTRLFNVMNG